MKSILWSDKINMYNSYMKYLYKIQCSIEDRRIRLQCLFRLHNAIFSLGDPHAFCFWQIFKSNLWQPRCIHEKEVTCLSLPATVDVFIQGSMFQFLPDNIISNSIKPCAPLQQSTISHLYGCYTLLLLRNSINSITIGHNC